MNFWILRILVPVLAMLMGGCDGCGGSVLSGDAAETVPSDRIEDEVEDGAAEPYHEEEAEPPTVCGNGIVEEGEECDGESRPCNVQGCGGGVQSCSPDCTWGPCVEEGMGVVGGPVSVSEDLLVWGSNNTLLWTGGMFRIFYSADADVPESRSEAYHSTLDGDGGLMGPPFLFTPSSIIADESHNMQYISAIHTGGELPFRVILEVNIGGVTRAYFTPLDRDGQAVLDPGIMLWNRVTFAKFRAYDGGTSLVAFYTGGDGQGIAFMSSSGEVERIYYPWYPEIYAGTAEDAVHDEDGFTAFMSYDPVDSPPYVWSFAMQSFDEGGSPLTEPVFLFENELLNAGCMFADWTGSRYGFVYAEKPAPEDPSRFYTLMFKAVDRLGADVVPAVEIGTVVRATLSTNNADLVWTGSEFGVAYIRPEGDNYETVLELARIGDDGTVIGDPVPVERGLDLRAPALAWTGSRYGVSWNEPYDPTMDDCSLHFALVGCPP